MNILISALMFLLISSILTINSINWQPKFFVDNNMQNINTIKIYNYEKKYKKTLNIIATTFNKNKNSSFENIILNLKKNTFFNKNWNGVFYKHNNQNLILIYSKKEVNQNFIKNHNNNYNAISLPHNTEETKMDFNNNIIIMSSNIIPKNRHVFIISI